MFNSVQFLDLLQYDWRILSYISAFWLDWAFPELICSIKPKTLGRNLLPLRFCCVFICWALTKIKPRTPYLSVQAGPEAPSPVQAFTWLPKIASPFHSSCISFLSAGTPGMRCQSQLCASAYSSSHCPHLLFGPVTQLLPPYAWGSKFKPQNCQNCIAWCIGT